MIQDPMFGESILSGVLIQIGWSKAVTLTPFIQLNIGVFSNKQGVDRCFV